MAGSTIDRIDARLDKLAPGSLRRQVLAALRRFRASWVELGRLLNEVAYDGCCKEWGYDDFEVYCARELGLKKPPVQKLMASYNYMKKYEEKRLRDFEDRNDSPPRNIPDFQTVELLDRARRREALPEDEVSEWHRRIFVEDEGEPEIRREIRRRLRPAPHDGGELDGKTVDRRRELSGILKLARELRFRLSTSEAIPAGLREKLELALVELEGLE